MDGRQFLLLLFALSIHICRLQEPEEEECKERYGFNNNITKPACNDGETCIELGVKNFSVYVEDHSDYVTPFDYMNVVTKDVGRQYYELGKQMKTGFRKNDPPLIWFSRHQIPSDHDPPFFAQLYSDSVEIVTMGNERLATQGRRDVFRIQTRLTWNLTVEEVKRAFVYKEYIFINAREVVDFRRLYDRRGPFIQDVNRPGQLEESDVGRMDIESIPIEHIDRDFLNLIVKKCFLTNKYCSLDIKTESLDLQDYPVAFTYDDLTLESFWYQRFCEMLPMYRIRHKKTAPNVIFDFPEVETLITHGPEKLSWVYFRPLSKTKVRIPYTRRGILPIVQPNDRIYEFVNKYTTPAPAATAPPPAATTLKPVLAGPAPRRMEMEEDAVEFESQIWIEPFPNNGPAISTIPFIYYMLGYVTFYSKSFHL